VEVAAAEPGPGDAPVEVVEPVVAEGPPLAVDPDVPALPVHADNPAARAAAPTAAPAARRVRRAGRENSDITSSLTCNPPGLA
jgi:hypothetical protein